MEWLKITFICLMGILLHQRSFAPNVSEPIYLYVNHYHNKELEERKIKIVKAIYEVEHPHTIQQAIAANIRESAIGILQLRPVAIQEANRIVGYNKYFLNDRVDSTKSIEIFFVIQTFWNPSFDAQKAAYIWVGGSNYQNATKEQWKKLNVYWSKVLNNLNKING
jgi:hypothetical protein